MAARFSSVTEAERVRLVEDAKSVNTTKATNLWLRAVTEFREEKKIGLSFATCSAEEMNDFLCRFYAEL